MTLLDPAQKVVVDHLVNGLRAELEAYMELSVDAQERFDLEDAQARVVFDLLDKLGLSLEVLAKLNAQQAMVFAVEHVRHYKGGHYVVLGEGIHTETEEDLVCYYNLAHKAWYARPKAMFWGWVDQLRQRFVRFTPDPHLTTPAE